MPSTGPRYPKEEFARRGDAAYDRYVRPNVKPNDEGKYAAIDIETREYEIDEDDLTACKKLEARVSDP